MPERLGTYRHARASTRQRRKCRPKPSRLRRPKPPGRVLRAEVVPAPRPTAARFSAGSGSWSIVTAGELAGVARGEGLTAEEAFDAVQDAFQTFITLPAARRPRLKAQSQTAPPARSDWATNRAGC